MNIDELERLAREAEAWSETIGEDRWYDTRELVALGKMNVGSFKDIETIHEADAAYIAAASPDVMAKLIAVVRAAQALTDGDVTPRGIIPEGDALREALAAIGLPA